MAGKLASHYAGTSPEKIPFRLCCESLRAGDKIVSVGGDHELLWLRNTVLQSAGFKVLTTEDESTALEQISQMDCGVLLGAGCVDALGAAYEFAPVTPELVPA